eukprot:TRINITY_DN2809_c0_g1_i2.p1 TRINITY_DN2809_c0_g1~~TRINITY_DN2809_c0_g1_i2.p1  ORF type:complete len:647 (+),score=123.06 TRINITY_DN2809_c0_g1_i2:57-1943(+)
MAANSRTQSSIIPGSHLDLRKGMNVANDFQLNINGQEMHLHRSFIKLRSPALLEASLHAQPIDTESADIFKQFLYSGKLPKMVKPAVLLGVAYLLKVGNFIFESQICLKSLQNKKRVTLEELLEIYCYCLDLNPFDEGMDVVINLLRKRRSEIGTQATRIPLLLGKHSDKALEFMGLVMSRQEEKPNAQTQTGADRPPSGDLEQCLDSMFTTKVDADFEIAINGEQESIIAHSFVLYARWPYFRHMFDSDLRHQEQRRLVIAGPNTEGGIPKHVLGAIIKFLYMGKEPAESDLDANGALQLLAVSGLYLSRDDEPQLFKSLVSWSSDRVNESLTLYNAVEVFRMAADLKLDQVAACAKGLIVENIQRFMKNDKRSNELKSLPSELLFQLFDEAFQAGKAVHHPHPKPAGRFGIRNVLFHVSDEDETVDEVSDAEATAHQVPIVQQKNVVDKSSLSATISEDVVNSTDKTWKFVFSPPNVSAPPGGFNFGPNNTQHTQSASGLNFGVPNLHPSNQSSLPQSSFRSVDSSAFAQVQLQPQPGFSFCGATGFLSASENPPSLFSQAPKPATRRSFGPSAPTFTPANTFGYGVGDNYLRASGATFLPSQTPADPACPFSSFTPAPSVKPFGW